MQFPFPVLNRLVVTDGSRIIQISTIGSLAQILFQTTTFGDIARLRVDTNISPPDFFIDSFFAGDLNAYIRFAPASSFIQLSAVNGTATDDCYLYIEAGQPARLARPLVSTNNNGSTIPETWHTINGSNGWTAGSPAPQYRLMPDGTVLLKGVLTGGTTVDGTTITTLPAGYQPQVSQHVICSSTGSDWRKVVINSNGSIQIFHAIAADIRLDNVRFPLGLIA